MLERVAEALAELEDVDLDGLSAEELNEAVEGFQRLRGKLEAAEARVLARWDANRCWRLNGAKTAGAWLGWRCRLPAGVARQRVRHARAMRDLPEVARAWGDGDIDRSHVITLLGARNPRTADAFATDHKVLLDAARTKGYVGFKRACDLWVNTVDQDGAEQDAVAARDGREVHLSESFGGMWFGRMTFDPVSGTIVAETLAAIEGELFEADWGEATERLGREPLVGELGRTPAQRRADAMVEMAARARTAPEGGRRPAPLFTVVVGYETLVGPVLELFNRTVLTPGTAARWLTDADVERIVFDGPSRVIDVGAQRRFFRGALRRAIEVRDRTCFHPTCDEVPERPHIDHIDPAAGGGLTTQANGRRGCDFHNRRRNHHPHGEAHRPHPPRRRRRAHHPSQRPARLRLPQPPPQPPPRRRSRRPRPTRPLSTRAPTPWTIPSWTSGNQVAFDPDRDTELLELRALRLPVLRSPPTPPWTASKRGTTRIPWDPERDLG